MAMPPGPRAPAIVQALRWTRDPIGWIERCRERYGDVFSVRFPFFGRMVYVTEPALLKELFTADSGTLHAGEANAIPLGPALGSYSLLTLDEGEHMRQRKLMLPPFHGEAVKRYGEVIEDVAARDLETWPLGEPFALRQHMQYVTLEVILRAVFGLNEPARIAEFRRRMVEAQELGSNAIVWVPPLRRDLGRWSPWARYKAAVAAVDELIYEEIARRRAAPDAAEREDVLSLLLRARHDDGTPMSDGELRDELMTLVAAGHETTATGLAWAFERLTRTPRVLERLRTAIAEGEDEYLDAVVKETLRVRPVVSDVARLATRDLELGGYTIPARTVLLGGIVLVHLRGDLYPDPHEFRPERFLDGQSEPYSWIPFGGGVRRCLGAAFAQYEMRVVLRTILPRVRLRAADRAPERPKVAHVTLVPARGAEVVLEERIDPTGAPVAPDVAAAPAA